MTADQDQASFVLCCVVSVVREARCHPLCLNSLRICHRLRQHTHAGRSLSECFSHNQQVGHRTDTEAHRPLAADVKTKDTEAERTN